MIKQYPQAPRISKADRCHSDSPRSRYMTQANQNFSLTCYRILSKKTLFSLMLLMRSYVRAWPLCGAWTICGHASLAPTTFASHTTGEKRKGSFSVGKNNVERWKESMLVDKIISPALGMNHDSWLSSSPWPVIGLGTGFWPTLTNGMEWDACLGLSKQIFLSDRGVVRRKHFFSLSLPSYLWSYHVRSWT